MMILLLLFAVFLNQASASPASEPINFLFSSFNSESCSNGSLICMGSVSSSNNGYLSLTPDLPIRGNVTYPPFLPPTITNQVGRVLYKQPVLAWPAMISTTFTIRISTFPNATFSGDGMTFIIAPNSNPSPPNSDGSYLGVTGRTSLDVGQLAVEMDTYKNEFDIDDNHISIDTTSVIKPVIARSLYSSGIDLKSGKMIKVKIDYDGWTKMLYVSVGYLGQPLQSFLEKPIIMSDTVPSWVYVGFTASTGDLAESHQVLDWSFTSMPLPTESLNRKMKIG